MVGCVTCIPGVGRNKISGLAGLFMFNHIGEARRKEDGGRRKTEEGRRKKEDERRKKEEGRRKQEEGRRNKGIMNK